MTSCVAGAAAEPQAGTAASATTWLCLEQPGPWGRDALTESHLDRGLGAELTARAAGTGVRIVLIRRPGRHPDRHVSGVPRRVYLAHTAPGRTRLARADLVDPKELLDVDLAAAGRGEFGGFGVVEARPVLMVCANSRRDVCCALLGRPLAHELAGRHPGAVWECTHIGGHRFAPTAVLLPTGYTYGRLDVAAAESLLTGREVRVERCRGRSTWDAAGQVADLAVRSAEPGLSDPDAIIVGDPEPAGEPGRLSVPVSHVDGRTWTVLVRRAVFGPDRPASCGAAPGPSDGYEVEAIRA